ncbi:signal transduction histidine kinase [Kibdelosporangium banguiense]|uniref:histidine kinase n=1 Tax=Kibdelosporangium banguiense TaxID=1365924 RepID=A0ABS4TLW2_9PSEU|nr:sensor histidine kinase [Kibdelosporangium banguiense]MBP2325414.1 signal transduction histidine kinase [Kibdelosporangium banguiense]
MKQWVRDALFAALVLAGVLVATAVQGGVELPGVVTIALTCGILAFRRRFPVTVAIGTVIGCGLYYPFVGSGGPLLAAFVFALYTVAAAGRLVAASVIAVVAMGGIAAGEILSPRRHLDDIALFMLVGWLVAVIALGAARHSRRAFVAEAEKRATGEERLRIARELHDVLAHNISLINVQASAALHRKKGETEALEAIKHASKDALKELRATLGLLRQVDEQASTKPPGLQQLSELVERTRATGIKVNVDGEPRPLPPEVDLAAYRIIQEALTNVTRHASAHEVHVRIHYGDKDMRVQVDDDGRGGDVTAGNGIRGMTERAEAVGGDLSVHSDGNGVRVAARFPIGATE